MSRWEKCEDVVDGEATVKRKGETYLPRPARMDQDEYSSYKQRAEFFNAASRTLDGLHGMIFSKNPIVNIDDSLFSWTKNVDGTGKDIKTFINEVTKETLKLGFGGILLDSPSSENAISLSDAESQNIFPYFSYYKPQAILDIQTQVIGRQRVFSMIKLEEWRDVQTDSEFVSKSEKIIRVLSLDENGYYKQRVFDEKGTLEKEVFPQKNGQNMTFIPFYPIPSDAPQKPILEDLIDVNLAWYRKSADIENGAHWTGVPTPIVIGLDQVVEYNSEGKEVQKDPISLGGSKFVIFPQGVTHVGYLEFSGSGLNQLASLMDRDEERMAILGARIISSEKKGVESAEAAEIHRTGENSVLSSFANMMSAVFTRAFIDYLSWCTGIEKEKLEDVSIQLNTDYNVSKMDSSQITALVSCWQSGGISKRVMFNNFKKGELIPNEMSLEEMQEEIDMEKESQLKASQGIEYGI